MLLKFWGGGGDSMANNEGHEGEESPPAAVNYFFYLAKCYWLIVAMEICRRTALEKKNGFHMREKSGMLLLSVFLPFSFFQGKKTKETGDEMEGKTKWRMF